MTKKNYGGYFVTSHFVLSSRHKTKRWSEIHLDLVLSLYVRTITIFKVRHNEKMKFLIIVLSLLIVVET